MMSLSGVLSRMESRLDERITQRFSSLLPILERLPRYDTSWLRLDVVAGITVAASVIPGD